MLVYTVASGVVRIHLGSNEARYHCDDRGTMRYKRLIAIGAVALALGACSSSPASKALSTTSTTGGGPTTTTTPSPNVQPLLLSITDLPTGWSVDNTPQSSSTSCYTNPLAQVSSRSYAHIDFAQGGGLPELAEELGYYASGLSSFATISKTLNSCKTFTETSKGQVITGSMGVMSSPTYGDQSAAYDATLTIQGVDVNQGFVMVLRGNYITLVALGDIGSLDTPTLQGFVNQAVGKIPAG